MEKTMEYALNEALETGRRSAMPVFLEKELREKIAQQVETLQSWVDETAATVMYKERVLETIRTGL